MQIMLTSKCVVIIYFIMDDHSDLNAGIVEKKQKKNASTVIHMFAKIGIVNIYVENLIHKNNKH